MTQREVVVTGSALMTPLGDSVEAVWDRYLAGGDGFRAISLFQTVGSPVKFAGEHAAPDTKKLPDRKYGKILSRRDLTSVLTSVAAFKDARLDEAGYAPERLGMFVGASCTHLGDLTPSLPLVAKHVDLKLGTFDSSAFGCEFMETLNPIVVLRLLMNNAVCFGTISLRIKGVSSNYMQQEVSGLRALGEAYFAVAEGRADAVLAGGTAQPIEAFQIAEARHCGFLADQTAPGFDPKTAVRPYDEQAGGTILSEATAYLVLEDGAKARARGATILGRVVGFGLAADGEPDSARPEAPSGGLLRAFAAARARRGAAGDLGAIFGNGSGVPDADRKEAATYVELLGPLAGNVPICSFKGALGETAEAHGAVAAALALTACARGFVPPTRNHERASEAARSLQVTKTSVPLGADLAAVVSRSRFGVNAVLLVESAKGEPARASARCKA